MARDQHEQEEIDFNPASLGEIEEHEAADRGSRRRDCQWILSGRDAWHKNPYYVGPDQIHPEEQSLD